MNRVTRDHLRAAMLIGWSLYLIYLLARYGVDRSTLVKLGLFVIWASAAVLAKTRLSRPAQTYAYLAWFSSMVAAAFVAMPVASHADPTMGAIAWAGVTLLGLIWCIYYERTAPGR